MKPSIQSLINRLKRRHQVATTTLKNVGEALLLPLDDPEGIELRELMQEIKVVREQLDMMSDLIDNFTAAAENG